MKARPSSDGSQTRPIALRVNGRDERLQTPAHHTLLEALRDQLRLRSVREGCGIGMCGACTVLIDGKPISSCLLLAPLAAGKEITTVEALGQDQLHPIQQAFVDHTAFQCSSCTPGLILTTKALLQEHPSPTA